LGERPADAKEGDQGGGGGGDREEGCGWGGEHQVTSTVGVDPEQKAAIGGLFRDTVALEIVRQVAGATLERSS
jgi:hypothetical protein